jgi:hypothetical protein
MILKNAGQIPCPYGRYPDNKNPADHDEPWISAYEVSKAAITHIQAPLLSDWHFILHL